jgi:hypothetical protein
MLTNTLPDQTSALNQKAMLQLQHRLIAVWALAEGTLGGVLHGLHIPVTGLVIGSISVCCLALLSRLKRRPGDLLKATFLVLLIKGMLSPHTPPAAYLAVFSQGFVAELLFSSSSNFKVKGYIFAILTQLQSAIQHLLVVTIVFGLDLWQGIDKYLNLVSKNLGLEGASYAFYIAAIYVAFHALMGIIVGWIAGNLPTWLPKTTDVIMLEPYAGKEIQVKSRSNKFKQRSSLILIWVVLLLVFLQSYFGLEPQILPQTKVAQILVRSALIGFAWYFMLSPILLKLVHSWLQRKKGPLQNELEAILNLLPETKYILEKCWLQSATESGYNRLKVFIKTIGQQLFALPAGVN